MHLPRNWRPKLVITMAVLDGPSARSGLVVGILDRMNMVRLSDPRQSGQLAIRP